MQVVPGVSEARQAPKRQRKRGSKAVGTQVSEPNKGIVADHKGAAASREVLARRQQKCVGVASGGAPMALQYF